MAVLSSTFCFSASSLSLQKCLHLGQHLIFQRSRFCCCGDFSRRSDYVDLALCEVCSVGVVVWYFNKCKTVQYPLMCVCTKCMSDSTSAIWMWIFLLLGKVEREEITNCSQSTVFHCFLDQLSMSHLNECQ